MDMHSFRRIVVLAVVAVIAAASACSNVANERADAAVDAPPGFVVSGTVVGPRAAAGPVAVVWAVDGQNGNYLYKLGDGTATATTFNAGLLGDPPPDARILGPSIDLGIAFVVLLAPGGSVPDGKVTAEPASLGVSAQYAIIYRGPTDPGTAEPWLAAFPIGLSCGRCVPATTGFDTFEPVSCTMLVIETAPMTNICNYT
jgi:hypothetical protein